MNRTFAFLLGAIAAAALSMTPASAQAPVPATRGALVPFDITQAWSADPLKVLLSRIPGYVRR